MQCLDELLKLSSIWYSGQRRPEKGGVLFFLVSFNDPDLNAEVA